MTNRHATIKAISSYLPEQALTNEQLAEHFGRLDSDKVLDKIGIAVRRVAAPDECASDLGVAAARVLFGRGVCTPSDPDFLLFCTQTPDYLLPASACTMHGRLGLRLGCGAIDFNQGCSGFVYGLAVAKGLIETGSADNVLLITADTYTKLINARDRTLRTLFGDGASATLISAVDSAEEMIGPFVFGTDGGGAENLIVPAGGMRCPISAEAMIEREDDHGNWRSQANLFMNGGELFNFALKTVPRAFEQLLQKASLTSSDIDLVVMHQANKFMLERLREKIKIPAKNFCIDMEESGNTVSCTIPIALERAMKNGVVKSLDRVALVGFGVGYSWAAALVRFSEV